MVAYQTADLFPQTRHKLVPCHYGRTFRASKSGPQVAKHHKSSFYDFTHHNNRRILWAIVVRTPPVDTTSPPAPPNPSLTDSLDRLFRRHDRWFRPLIRRRHGHFAADDLVHESYLRAAPYLAAGTLRHPKALLIRIADNLASNMRRDSYLEITEDPASKPLDKHATTPTQDYAVTFKQIVLALPAELRDVFVLNHVQGMTYEEIAVHLGIPRTTVHHRMRKALEKTSKAMRD